MSQESKDAKATAPETTPVAPNKIQTKKQMILDHIKSFGLALLLVMMVRSSLIEAFIIPSGSMIPTLMVGDRIFVNKFAYGFKLPFSDFFTDEPLYLVKRDPPKSGDVIVFKYPKDESVHYIKRVIGVPGDRIKVREKVVYVNDVALPQTPVAESATKDFFEMMAKDHDSQSVRILQEPNRTTQKPHYIMLDDNTFIAENHAETIVPPDHLFVMGDNRDNSQDSRFWGFVPYRNVRGQAMVVWLSLWVDFTENWYDPTQWTATFHPSRFGLSIE